MNADAAAMEFFPSCLTREQSMDFLLRMQSMYEKKAYCYFAVDLLSKKEIIGFIGLCEQIYESEFTPCVDIGWRISPLHWNNGYATEGAIRCLQYAFETLILAELYAIAPKVNLKSERIMKKIGMKKAGEFIHPKLAQYPTLKVCVIYHKKQINIESNTTDTIH